jgi:[acyl-carrier-protein] S-malonyltransferase
MSPSGRETAVVICPGRGSYNQPELGYLQRYHPDKQALFAAFDDYRRQRGQPSLSTLDRGPFQSAVHGRGDNASALIHACALADFQSIDTDRYDIVAVTGNSLGWYLALACAGALDRESGIHLVNTMGTLMHREDTGGQVIYPLVSDDWRPTITRVR